MARLVIRVPSLKTIKSVFGRQLRHDWGDKADAKAEELREALVEWRDGAPGDDGDEQDALDVANKVLRGHGVEVLRSQRAWDSYYGDAVALYVNMGDPYVPTLLFNIRRGSWYVGDWGTWVESHRY